MRYRIDAKLVAPTEDFDLRGYYVDAFFKGTLDQSFASHEDAERWVKENYLGPDKHGVKVEWSVYGEGPELLKQRFRF